MTAPYAASAAWLTIGGMILAAGLWLGRIQAEVTALKPPNYRPHLDALRALAVALVLIQHAGAATVRPGSELDTWSPGQAGVRLFFVLSGFLISGILIHARDDARAGRTTIGQAWRAFYARRALRIFPLYYAALAFTVVAGYRFAAEAWPVHAVYLQNVAWLIAPGVPSAPSLGHFWSLAVEEQVYLFWPLLIFWTPVSWLCPVLVILAMAATVTRVTLAATMGTLVATSLTPARLDAFALGALLASGQRLPRPVLWGAGLLLAANLVEGHWSPAWSAALVEPAGLLLSGALIVAAASGFRGRLGRVASWPPLLYVGRISYGIYVLHFFVHELVRRIEQHWDIWLRYPEPGMIQFVVLSAISVAAASVSWTWFERPIQRLKARVPYMPPQNRDLADEEVTCDSMRIFPRAADGQ